MGIIQTMFEVTDKRLQALYRRTWLDVNRGFVDSSKYFDFDRATIIYAREHNCSYEDALIFAETGKKTGRLVE